MFFDDITPGSFYETIKFPALRSFLLQRLRPEAGMIRVNDLNPARFEEQIRGVRILVGTRHRGLVRSMLRPTGPPQVYGDY